MNKVTIEQVGEKHVPVIHWPDGTCIHVMPFVIPDGQDPAEQLQSWLDAWLKAERCDDVAYANAVLVGLEWMGDGYEWNPPHGDYREAPANAVDRAKRAWNSLTADLSTARQKIAELEAERKPYREQRYCPECGHEEYTRGIWREGNEERICDRCEQSWFHDVDYRDGMQENLEHRYSLTTQLTAANEKCERLEQLERGVLAIQDRGLGDFDPQHDSLLERAYKLGGES